MRRKQPDKEIRPVVSLPSTIKGDDEAGEKQVIKQERQYKLITPLYGGGVEPESCDPITLLRGTEIRGLLRFWWRACFAGRYESIAEMKKAEDSLWGKAATKDESIPWHQTVQITIEVMPRNSQRDNIAPFIATKVEKKTFHKSSGKRIFWDIKDNLAAKTPAYAAFPLRPEEKVRVEEKEPKILPVYLNVSFILTIIFPNDDTKKKEIEGALWAWETFGGIGARTRRGFGALQIQSSKQDGENVPLDLPSAREVEKWIQGKFEKFGLANKPSKLAPALTLEKIAVIRTQYPQNDEVTQIWKLLIDKLQDFRQKKKKNGKSSIWTEAKSTKDIVENIRALRERRGKRKSYSFPKAVFGLPIVFSVKNGSKMEKLILQGKEEHKERLASPLLLRPFACGEKKAVGLAILLEQRDLPPRGLHVVEIDDNKKIQELCSADIIIPEQDTELLEFLDDETDVLQHFWETLKG